MLKEKALFWAQVTRAADLAVVTLTFYIAYQWRYSLGIEYLLNLHYIWIIPFFWLLWGSLLQAFGMYESMRLKKSVKLFGSFARPGSLVF
jgi:hypothetical protein